MSKIDEKLGEVIDKLTKLAETHGGAAVDLAVAVAQTDAIAGLVTGLGWMIVFMVAVFTLRYALAAGRRAEWEEGAWIPCSVGGGIGFFVAGIFAFMQLTNYWFWAGAFNPKLALAKQIMKAAGL